MSKRQIAHRVAIVAILLLIFSVPFCLKNSSTEQAYLAARSPLGSPTGPSNSEVVWTATAGNNFNGNGVH